MAEEGSVLDALLPDVYQELRRLAGRAMRGERPDHTLQPTALVHEAYLKLIGRREAHFDDRAHFFAYAASAMRSVVVDYARQRSGAASAVATCIASPICPRTSRAACVWIEDTLGLDVALTRLAAVERNSSPRWSSCAISPGCPNWRIAALLERSERSIRRDWQKARLFLLASLKDD